ncbi:MAG: antitoxin [Alphaproteobacteria bacterium]|nr:MAG: antitoxin [Alphaproteobacteria bacterium]
MSKSRWSVQDAKNRLSAVIEAARRHPQTITRHGKPAAVVVDVEEYERLRAAAQSEAPSFAEFLLAMPRDDGVFECVRVRPRDFTP